MAKLIRKISIGTDYKNEAMHYSVGQQVYGGHCICDILYENKDNSYNIFIKKKTKLYHGRSLILIWLFQLNMI